MSDTVLIEFVREKVGSYQPPSRENVPKGDAIGPSVERLRSQLLTLTSLPKIEVARVSGLPYDSLKALRWRPDYKKQLAILEKEFAGKFADETVKFVRENMVVSAKEGGVIGMVWPDSTSRFADVAILSRDAFEGVIRELGRREVTDEMADGIIREFLPILLALRRGQIELAGTGEWVEVTERVEEKGPVGGQRSNLSALEELRAGRGRLAVVANLTLYARGYWEPPRQRLDEKLTNFVRVMEGIL